MKKIFIGSALRGDQEANKHRAVGYCRKAAEKGYLPIAPHIIFTQFLDEDDESEREKGIEMGLELLRTCDEVVFFGDITEGMQRELNLARELGLPVRRFDEDGTISHEVYVSDQIKQMSLISGISADEVEQYIDAEDEYYRSVGLIVEPEDENFGELQSREDICIDDDKLCNYITGSTGISVNTYRELNYAEYVYLSELGLIKESPDDIEEDFS